MSQALSFSLEGKLALVTGGASGIGAAIVETLAEAGAEVVIADIDELAAKDWSDELNAKGCSTSAIRLDLASEDSIVHVCQKVVSDFGIPWVLVNNAGLQDRQSFFEGTAEEWDRMDSVNARGPFLLTRGVAAAMRDAEQGGRIVNIASAVLRGSIIKGLAAYAGSKGALLGLSGATAFELAEYGITVNTILPGATITPGAMNAKGPAAEGPARRALPLGHCEGADIAAAVLYFASPAARKVTNQVLAVDGGFSVT